MSCSYSELFISPAVNTVTAHIYGKTRVELAEMKTKQPWNGFKDVVGASYPQTIACAGGTGLSSFTYAKDGTNNVNSVYNNSVVSSAIGDWWVGDYYQLSIQVHSDETFQVIRNGLDVTDYFVQDATNKTIYSFMVDNPEESDFYAATGVNPWSEATWIVKITPKTSSPYLKMTTVNGAGGTTVMTLTNNGRVVTEKRSGAGKITVNLTKEKLGDEFLLKIIPDKGRQIENVSVNGVTQSVTWNGDTAVYDLGNLKQMYDSVVISSVYKDRFDFTKRRLTVKTSGTPEGLVYYVLYDRTNKANVFTVDASTEPTIDRSDTLDVGTSYNLRLLGKVINLKRVTINGEEVEMTGNVSKSSPTRILSSYDDVILIEFENVHYQAHAYTTSGMIASNKFNEDGSVNIADVVKLVNKILGNE
ncbi:MAG: hypothetical protein IJK42_12135 [Prevotella sp.]|nr:hypothetical protein [Prevotella sp.]